MSGCWCCLGRESLHHAATLQALAAQPPPQLVTQAATLQAQPSPPTTHPPTLHTFTVQPPGTNTASLQTQTPCTCVITWQTFTAQPPLFTETVTFPHPPHLAVGPTPQFTPPPTLKGSKHQQAPHLQRLSLHSSSYQQHPPNP